MNEIVIPTHCPCCSSALELVNDQLYCRNNLCPAQTKGKVSHFAKTVGIKGLGEKTIEKLQFESIIDIYYTEPVDILMGIGDALGTKLLNEITNSKQAQFSTVLSALSIPLIGSTAANKLAVLVNSFEEISVEVCKEAGLGDKATSNLMYWINTEYQELKDCEPFTFKFVKNEKVASVADKGVICITGKLSSYKNKSEASALLESMGYKVVDSLTKSVTILVDESGTGSSKRKTAEERGLNIITDLRQFINN